MPSSSVHGILQARILEWEAISFSRESFWPRDWTRVSCIAGGIFTIWVTKEAPSPPVLEAEVLPTGSPEKSDLCLFGQQNPLRELSPLAVSPSVSVTPAFSNQFLTLSLSSTTDGQWQAASSSSYPFRQSLTLGLLADTLQFLGLPSPGSLVHSQDWNPDCACPDGPLSLAQVSPECQTLGSAAPRSLYMGGSWGVLLNWTILYPHHLPNLLLPHPPSWKKVASSLELLSQDFGVTLSPHIPSKPWLFSFKNYIKFLGLPRWSSG